MWRLCDRQRLAFDRCALCLRVRRSNLVPDSIVFKDFFGPPEEISVVHLCLPAVIRLC